MFDDPIDPKPSPMDAPHGCTDVKLLPPFRRSLPMLLNRTLDQVMPVYRELFARFDLTEQQWRVLRVLWREDKIKVRDLAAETLLPAPSLVGILDRLEKKALVVRVRSDVDRRDVFVEATTYGKALSQEVLPLVERIQQHTRACLKDEEWSMMEQTLAKLGESLSSISLQDLDPRTNHQTNQAKSNSLKGDML